MKNIYLILTTILIGGFFYAYHSYSAFYEVKDLWIYETEIGQFEYQKADVKMGLKAGVEQSTLLLSIQLKNRGESFMLNPADWQITTQEGWKAKPVSETQAIEVKKGGKLSLEWEFEPLNNLALFRKTNLRGTLRSHYIVSVSQNKGDGNPPLNFHFFMPQEQFDDYQSEYAVDLSVKMFGIEPVNEGIAEKWQNYWSLNLYKQESDTQLLTVKASEEELFTAGLLFKPALYILEDTLYLNWQWVNHTVFDLKLYTEELSLIINDDLVKVPWGFMSKKNLEHQQQVINIPRGQRAFLKAKLQLKEAYIEKIKLKNMGIHMYNGFPFFPKNSSLIFSHSYIQ